MHLRPPGGIDSGHHGHEDGTRLDNRSQGSLDEVLLKLATWNLRRVMPSQRRCSDICKQIRRVDADVWVLTETHEEVRPSPLFHGVTTGAPDRPGSPGERWVAIWSKHPVTPMHPTSDQQRAVAARIEPPGAASLRTRSNRLRKVLATASSSSASSPLKLS